MSIGYMDIMEIERQLKRGRKAFTVKNITVSDSEEYSNNCLITLKNEGFDTTMLILPKLFKSKDRTATHMIYFIRKGQENSINLKALEIWSKKMGNVDLYLG